MILLFLHYRKFTVTSFSNRQVDDYLALKCQKPTLFENFNQSISPDFRGENKILLVDLASAEKITLTIREEKMKKMILT